MVALEEEQELVLRCRNGDPEAFATLVRNYQRMVHAIAYRMTGSLADAEDLAQETFVRAYRQIDGFRGDAKFSSWLYRVTVNTTLNWVEREQRRRRAYDEFAAEAELPAASDANGAASRRIQEALLKLPPKQRAAVILTTYDHVSHGEAAKVLGCSESTVSWRVFAARRKLRRLLRDLAPPARGPL